MNNIQPILLEDPQTKPQTRRCIRCGRPVYPNDLLCGHCRRERL